MNQQGMPATATALVIGVIVLVPAAFGWLVTTFLFAFSGGQYRMVAVVNYGALVVIAVGVVVAAATWLARSRSAALGITGLVTIGAWVAAVVIEWLLSFWFGA